MNLWNTWQDNMQWFDEQTEREMQMAEWSIKRKKVSYFRSIYNDCKNEAEASSGEKKISWQKMMGEIVISIADLMGVSITDDEKQALEDGNDLEKINEMYNEIITKPLV